MKKKIVMILIFLITQSNVYSETNKIEANFRYDFLWETLLPGYNFYRKNEMGWGHVFLFMRISSLYGFFYFHQRYVSYHSLYKASQLADLYYGLGYSYFDPIEGGYKNTKQFYIQAGRESSARNLSLSIHLLFLIVGLYKGFDDNWNDYVESAPVVIKNLDGLNFYQEPKISFSIRLDF